MTATLPDTAADAAELRAPAAAPTDATIDDTGTLILTPVPREGVTLETKPLGKYVPESPEEEKFLADYDPSRFSARSVTADAVMLTLRNGRLHILLVLRGGYPYKGRWALPGGFLEDDEDLNDAAVRELLEETSISADKAHFEQLGTYGAVNRDPRMRVVSVAYLALLPNQDNPEGGDYDDADDARWWPVDELTADMLAFDHPQIINDALERVRSKLEYTAVATSFLPDEFTLGELRAVYEAVWGVAIDKRNFNRKVLGTSGFVERIEGRTTTRSGGRPAQLYRKGRSVLLHPAFLRNAD